MKPGGSFNHFDITVVVVQWFWHQSGGSFNLFDITVVGVQWFWHQSGGCFNHFDIRWNHGQPELAPPTELDSQSGLQQWSPAIAHSIMRFIISYIISYIIRTILSYNISIYVWSHTTSNNVLTPPSSWRSATMSLPTLSVKKVRSLFESQQSCLAGQN